MIDNILPYTHIIDKRLKHIYLKIDKDKGLIIKSPKISKIYLEQIIQNKKQWAIKHFLQLQNKINFTKDLNNFLPQSYILFLGKKYPFKKIITQTIKTKIEFSNNIFILYTNPKNQNNIKLFNTKLDEFYKIQSELIIPNIVKQYSIIMNLNYKSISFRKTKRRWGSCSFDNHLKFSSLLVKASYDAIKSVVIHELAHIKYKNHSKNFYNLIQKFDPNYKQYKKELSFYV